MRTARRLFRSALVSALLGCATILGLVAARQATARFRPLQPDLFATPGALVVTLADVDGDGDPDIFVGFNGTVANRLYRNDDGTFSDAGESTGLADRRATRAAAFGDFDGDGDPDLLIGFAPPAVPAGGAAPPSPVLRLMRNDAGRFTDQTAAAGLAIEGGAVRQPVWVDFDADGDLDLFVAFRDRANALFRNDGGRFTDIATSVGLADARRSVGAVWADLDADGDLDVVVGNMDGDANGVFVNEGGTFTDRAEAMGLAWGGRAPGDATNGTVRPCVADVDDDGRFDLVFANYGPPGLFLASADGTWRDAGAAWGIAVDGRYDSCALADYDHDGRLDLYLNGTITQGKNWPDYLYRNLGAQFEAISPTEVTDVPSTHGAQWADVDGDGSADLVLAGPERHAVLATILAPAVAKHALRVRVLDARGRATRAGAEIRVFAAGTRRLLATRLVDAGSGYDAQTDIPTHIGVPSGGRVDIEVTWPAAGTRRVVMAHGVAGDSARVVELRIP